MGVIERIASRFVDVSGSNPVFWLFGRIYEIVDLRKNDTTKKKDYIQLLIDAETDEQTQFDDLKVYEYKYMKLNKKLTIDVILEI